MIKPLISLVAGAASVLAFAPFGWWPIMIPSLACLFALLYGESSRKSSALIGYGYGLGLFGAGVYWIYFSLHLFGAAIAPLAALGTFLFVAALALYPALFAAILASFPRTPVGWFLLAAPGMWLLVEWFRSWFLTGFPWLSIGYSTIHTPLAGFAPVGGVYLNSLLLSVICGVVALLFVERSRKTLIIAGVVTISIFLGGNELKKVAWTEASGDPVSVTMVQGNIDQELKFLPSLIEESLQTYASLSDTGSDLIIWPESAIPTFFSDVSMWEKEFASQMAEKGSVVVSGGFSANADYSEYYNAMKVLGGTDQQIYAKRHLVPFGEFIPFRGVLTFLSKYIQIPMSDLSPRSGPARPITIDGIQYGISICYEDAFGAELIEQLPAANILINISNDAWFGRSAAPHQHQEIAAMRALEFGRPLIRSTNTGISSFIAMDGSIARSGTQYVETSVSSTVVPRTGETFYVRVGNWLAVCLSILLLVLCLPCAIRSGS